VKIWIENAETLSIRAGLVHELGLAGIAGWQRSFATDDVWPACGTWCSGRRIEA
jgi:spore germination protein YaaH